MKRGFPALLAFVAIQASCYAQGLVVSAGQSFAFEFTDLPSLGVQSVPLGVPNCGVHFDISGFDGGSDRYTIELFENNLLTAPIATSDSINNSSGSFGAVSIWQDRQGWVRLSVISGDVRLNSVQIDVRTPINSSTVNLYESITALPVPEPSSLVLIWAAAIGCGFRRLSMRGEKRDL